jgi:23S rRNA (cytosine1962-C5)-methyltransferase
MRLLGLPPFPDYALLDCGGFEKLERFGSYVLIRPEPQAVWSKTRPAAFWESQQNARFTRHSGREADSGEWALGRGMPQQWKMQYAHGDMQLVFRLGLTAFKHVGIFPEQAENWNYLYDTLRAMPVERPAVLNLFAYTGGASLAARAAGAEVTHVDSVKQVITWARENMENSGLTDIRWVVEDAFKFVQREVRRGKRYHGIVLDPPAYGRGPDGEKWILEKQIDEMLSLCGQLLDPEHGFVLLNMYAMGLSALVAENLLRLHFGLKNVEAGELYVPFGEGLGLPLGTYARGSHWPPSAE